MDWETLYTHQKVRLISSILPDLNSSELQSLKEEISETISVQESPRPLGILKGQVKISEDFYQTSSDILSDFGIDE